MDETAAPAAVFRARGLSVAAGGTTLVSGLDLTLAPGELVALTGPSGGGKTTLLRALCALDDPAAGDVLLEGRSPTDWGHPAFRRRAVFVPQQPFLAPDETVDDALRRPFAFRSGRAAGQTYEPARTDALLDRLGVGSARREQRARSLSVGQQQRVCLVRAVLLSPAVLFLDEPTGALDPDATAAVEALISEEADVRGLAALIVTHNPEQAARWCSRRIDLRDFAPKAATL